MPLCMAANGETRLIKRVGGTDKIRRFLESLGFTAGTSVSVISEIAGNLIVQVKDARVAVSREMAEKIYI